MINVEIINYLKANIHIKKQFLWIFGTDRFHNQCIFSGRKRVVTKKIQIFIHNPAKKHEGLGTKLKEGVGGFGKNLFR